MIILQPILDRPNVTWWTFVGCGTLATATAALARRTQRSTSVGLALATTLPLAWLALIFAQVTAGWLAAAGIISALTGAHALARRS